MASVHRSLAIALAERYALIALSLVSYVVVARLLTPAEIGIYAIATALIGMAQVIRDFGVGSFLIQEKQLTDAHIRSALGVSLLIGATLFAIFMLAAPFAGRFYGDVRVTGIVRLVAFNFLLLPFCSISISLLRREMLFGRMMAANLTAAVVGTIVTLGLAWTGSGPKSLAWGALAANVATGLVAWLVRKSRRLLWPSLSEFRAIARFGRQTTIAAVITSAAMDANDLVVGKVLGFSPVAMLSRAQGLMNLFHRDIMSAVRGVAYPAFAKAHREGEAMDPKYIASVTNLTVFAWPFYGMAALYPLEILRLVFGPQWDAAAQLVPIFCLAGAAAATYSLINPWMLAMGRVDLATRADLVVQPVRIVVIVAATLIFKSLLACALAFLLVFLVAAPVFYAFKSQCGATSYRQLWAGLWQSAKVTIACLAIPIIADFHFGFGRTQPVSVWLPIGLSFIVAVAWLTAIIRFRHPVAATPIFHRLLARFAFRG